MNWPGATSPLSVLAGAPGCVTKRDNTLPEGETLTGFLNTRAKRMSGLRPDLNYLTPACLNESLEAGRPSGRLHFL